MPESTPDELDRLADQIAKTADAVDDFAFRQRATLSREQVEQLRQLFAALNDRVDALTAESVRLRFAELAPHLDHVNKVVADVTAAVRRLDAVHQVLSLGAELVQLAEAVSTLNLTGVLTTVSSIEQLLPPPESKRSGG